jgi:parvulin-like peptidyl-prolyl isomerase
VLDVRPRRYATRLLVAGGALALLAHALSSTPDEQDAHTIVIDAVRIGEAERAYVATTGRSPDAQERAALLAAEVDDEILYREALARGLAHGDSVVQHRIAGNLAFVEDGPPPGLEPDPLAGDMLRQDVVVRRRLVERMRAQLEQAALADEPSEAELAQALAANAARFALPARVRIAMAPAVSLTDGTAEDTGTAFGAGIVRELPLESERDLARSHGSAFARAAFVAPPGEWTGPVDATSGRYRILVHAHEPTRLPPLDDVRNQLRELVRRERAAAALRRGLDELRRGYEVSFAAAAAERQG